MQKFENQEFLHRYDPDKIVAYSDLEFIKCKFYGGGFGYRHSEDFTLRTSASNIRIVNCEIQNFAIGPALLSDVHLENIRGNLLIVTGALFRHVTIKGRFDKLMIHGAHDLMVLDATSLAQYWDICNQFYNLADWILDISEAEFNDFGFRTGCVPVDKVRRDAETQVIVSREKAIAGKWRELNLSGITKIFFKDLIEDPSPASILVAPKRHKRDFKDIMEDIRKLRDAGIAELN